MPEQTTPRRMHDSGEEPFFYQMQASPSATEIWKRIVQELQELRQKQIKKGGSD